MVQRCLCIIIMTLSILPAGDGAEGGEGFELLSRSLMQGPPRTATYYRDGLILGTGGGIVVLAPAYNLDNPAFLPVEGEPLDIAVRENVAYTAASRGGLIAIDISVPSKPKAVFCHRTRRATACTVCGNFLFLSDMNKKLLTFDIANPVEPKLVNTKSLSLSPTSMALERDLLSIISTQTVEILRIRENGILRTLSRIKPPGNIKKGRLHGEILYLISLKGDLLRWSLEDPANPLLLPPIGVEGILDIAFEGTHGLILTKMQNVLPFETANGKSAGIRTGKETAGTETGSGAGSIGEMKIGRPLETNRTTGRTGSQITGIIDKLVKGQKTNQFKGSSIVLSGTGFTMISGREGFFFYDLDKRDARSIGCLPAGGFAIDLVASGDLLYLGNGREGLRIGRVHEDGSVDWIGHLQTTEARDVALSGTILTLCDGSDGLKTVDVSDPYNPRVIGRQPSPFFLSAIVNQDGKAYIAGGLGGVEVVDFRNAAHPRLTWRKEFSEVRGIHVEKEYLYFGDGFDGFRIFSLAGEKPSSVSVLDTEGWNCDVFVIGEIAYLADGGHGIKVVDISDPARPRILGSVDLGGLVREIHALDGTVFAAAHTGGIAAIDVSDPRAPFIAARYPSVDDARGVFTDGRFVYLASGSGGVYVFRYDR